VSSQTFSASRATYLDASFDPTLDWFVVRNVSLGLKTGVAYSDTRGYGADSSLVETRTTSVRVGPRVGVNLPLGRDVSLWPAAALGFEWVSETQSLVSGTSTSVSGNPLGYPSSTELGPWVELDVALLWHVAPHLFVGVVPGVFHGFGHVQGGPEVGGQETEVSAGFLLGGWFGGPPGPQAPRDAPEPTAPPPSPGPVRRFGMAGELAFSDELALGGQWTGYGGSSSSSSSGYLTAGIDYFPADYFSIGIVATGSLGGTTGIDSSTGGTVTSQVSRAGLGLRAGVNIPIGDHVSFWPRASVSFGAETINEQEAGATNKNAESITTIGIYAPVLVHPASHFFLGLGPSASTDLARSIAVNGAAGVQNTSTVYGAGLVVGGWL
jgi:hypothetical protein